MSQSEREDYDDHPPAPPTSTLVVPDSLKQTGICLIVTWSWFVVEIIAIAILDYGLWNRLDVLAVVSLMFGLCLFAGGCLVYTGSDSLLIFQLIGLVLFGLSCGGFGIICGPVTHYDYQDNLWEGPTRANMITGWIVSGISVVFLILVLASIIFTINYKTEHWRRANPSQENP